MAYTPYVGEGALEFDESRWPIVVISLRGQLDDEDYEQLMMRGEEILSRQERPILITDLSTFRRPADPKQRERLVRWATEMEKEFGEHALVSFMVLDSKVLRAAMTAFNWIRGKSINNVYVATLEEAMARAEEVRKQGLVQETHG